MRLVHAALLTAVTASPALAQLGPVIAIPGRPDIPIFENGVDVSWAVIEGEFGLNRPGLVTPTVIYRLPPVVVPYYGAAAYPGYYPRSDRQPGYGRLEVVPGPNRPLPPPAQSYRRSWSSNSAPLPPDYPSYNPGYAPLGGGYAPGAAPYGAPGSSFNGSSPNGPTPNYRPWVYGSHQSPGHHPHGGFQPGGPPHGGSPPPGGQSFNGPPGPPPNSPPGGQPPGPDPGHGHW